VRGALGVASTPLIELVGLSTRGNDSQVYKSYTVLTLFSKFLSCFPHGTCSLSVSRQYWEVVGDKGMLRQGMLRQGIPGQGMLRQGMLRQGMLREGM
jgi:hypothetical protein